MTGLSSNWQKYNISYQDMRFRLVIALGLQFLALVFFLPETHGIYKEYRRSMMQLNIIDLIKTVESHQICDGIGEDILEMTTLHSTLQTVVL